MSRNSSVQSDTIKFLKGHPDCVWTLDEIESELELPRSSIASALNRLLDAYPEHLRRPTRGSYVWSSEPVQPDADSQTPAEDSVGSQEDTQYLGMKVLQVKKDGRRLVQDVATGVVYILTELKF